MTLLEDESGAGVLEYGIVLALVAMVGIAALLLLGNTSNSSLNRSTVTYPSGAPGIQSSP